MGDRQERQMARFFDENGWKVARIAGSGSGTEAERVDLVAGNGELTLAIEEKYRTKLVDGRPVIYVSTDEHRAVSRFSQGLGLRPTLTPRWSTDLPHVDVADWFVVPIETAPRTRTENIVLNYSEVESEYRTLSDLVLSNSFLGRK